MNIFNQLFGQIYAIFNVLFIIPITNLLVVIYLFLSYLHVPYALGFSIILLTAAVRLILYPLTSAQIRSSKKMQDVAPRIAQIKARYKTDRNRQQQEIMKVYREEGINPASGCLPVLVQIPIIWSLYNVLTTILHESASEAMKHINSVIYSDRLIMSEPWDPTFFGLPLTVVPRDVFSEHPFYILVCVVTAGTQFVLSKMMMPATKAEDKKKKAVKKKDAGGADDFQAVFQKQMIFVFPVMIGWFSFVFPIGLSLYWNTFTLFGILQQYKLVGWGGMQPTVDRIKTFRSGK